MPHRVRLRVDKTGLPAGSIGTVIDEMDALNAKVVEFAGEDVRVIPNADLEDVDDGAPAVMAALITPGGKKKGGKAGGKGGGKSGGKKKSS